MKFQAIGVKTMSGISKKSGSAYQMGMVYGYAPIEEVQKEAFEIVGYGFEPAELQLDPACIEQFKDVKFPAQLELETDVIARMGKFETVVIGLKAKPAAVKAA